MKVGYIAWACMPKLCMGGDESFYKLYALIFKTSNFIEHKFYVNNLCIASILMLHNNSIQ